MSSEHAWPFVAVYGPVSYRRKVLARRVGYVLEGHEPEQYGGTWIGEWEDYQPLTFLPEDYDDQVWPRRHWA